MLKPSKDLLSYGGICHHTSLAIEKYVRFMSNKETSMSSARHPKTESVAYCMQRLYKSADCIHQQDWCKADAPFF